MVHFYEATLEPSWAILGAIPGHLGALLEPLGGHLGAILGHFETPTLFFCGVCFVLWLHFLGSFFDKTRNELAKRNDSFRDAMHKQHENRPAGARFSDHVLIKGLIRWSTKFGPGRTGARD